MQKAGRSKKKNFLMFLKKIESMTASQRRFIQEMLSRPRKAVTLPKKRILKKSFGLWADRDDIKSSTEHVTRLRSEWGAQLQRMKK